MKVLEAAGSEGAVVIGLNDGTIVAAMLAESRPELCRALVLWTLTASHTLAAGRSLETIDDVIEMIESDAKAGRTGVNFLAPSRMNDQDFDEHLARLQRYSVRPGAYAHYYRQTMEADVNRILPLIRCPTLVLNRRENPIVPIEQSRRAATAIPGAKFVELAGTDHLAYAEGVDTLLDEIEEFLTGSRTGGDPDRMLTTLLFTDIVGSTDLAANIGDRRWRDLLDRHHTLTRSELIRFGGREVATTGDGFFVTFKSPISAARCALALVDGMPGIGLQIRAGVHIGEVEVRGDDLGGLAVHVASRIAGLAGGGEVLVSSTVKDLLAGSEIGFEDRSERELKGVPGTWHLYSASFA